jgi:hypothetical protein
MFQFGQRLQVCVFICEQQHLFQVLLVFTDGYAEDQYEPAAKQIYESAKTRVAALYPDVTGNEQDTRFIQLSAITGDKECVFPMGQRYDDIVDWLEQQRLVQVK